MKDRKDNPGIHAVSSAHTHMLNPRKVGTFGVSATHKHMLSLDMFHTHVWLWLLSCDDIDSPSPPHAPAAARVQGERVI